MTRYEKGKEAARQYAINWQSWASTVSMTYDQLFMWQSIFERIAKKWGLLTEFRENGII